MHNTCLNTLTDWHTSMVGAFSSLVVVQMKTLNRSKLKRTLSITTTSGRWMGRRYPLHGCLSSQEDCCSIRGDVNLRCVGLLLSPCVCTFDCSMCERKTMPNDPDTIILQLHLSSSLVLNVFSQKLNELGNVQYSTFKCPGPGIPQS